MSESEAKELIKQLEEYQKEVVVSRESALAALVSAGILDQEGNLMPPYIHHHYRYICQPHLLSYPCDQ